MPYFVVDDQAHSHPKVVAAGNAAFGAWCRMGSWSRFYRTSGFIPAETAKGFAKPRELASLLKPGPRGEHGLLERVDGGYQIHDWRAVYDRFDEHAASARSELSAVRSAAGKQGAASRWQTQPRPGVFATGRDGKRDGKPDGKTASPPIPPSQEGDPQPQEDQSSSCCTKARKGDARERTETAAAPVSDRDLSPEAGRILHAIASRRSLAAVIDKPRLAEHCAGYLLTTGGTIEQLIAAVGRAADSVDSEEAGLGHAIDGPTVAKVVAHRCRNAAAWERGERERAERRSAAGTVPEVESPPPFEDEDDSPPPADARAAKRARAALLDNLLPKSFTPTEPHEA